MSENSYFIYLTQFLVFYNKKVNPVSFSLSGQELKCFSLSLSLSHPLVTKKKKVTFSVFYLSPCFSLITLYGDILKFTDFSSAVSNLLSIGSIKF